MKLIFLMLRQYSKFFIRELIIIIQILVLIVVLTPTLTELINMFAVDSLASQFTVPAVFFQSNAAYQYSDFLHEEDINTRFLKIKQCPLVKDVGYAGNAGCTINNNGTIIYFYNDAFVRSINLNILKGDKLLQTPKPNQISVLINRSMAERYDIGDTIPIDYVRFPVTSIDKDVNGFEFIVTGVLNDNGYYYNMNSGGSYARLESIGGNFSYNEYNMIATNHFDIVPVKDISPACMLFTENAEALTVDAINMELAGLGYASSIEVMRNNSIRLIILENPLILLSAAMLLLLCITGICSYTFLNILNMRRKFSIYYICGMSWSKSLFITIISLTVLLGISFAVALAVFPFIGDVITMQGLLYSSLFIVFLYILSIVTAIIRYKRIDPLVLLRRGD